MVRENERIGIVDAFADALARGTSIQSFLQVTFPGALRAEFQALPTDLVTVQDQATWVLDACCSHLWTVTPSLLERLLERLVNQYGHGGLQPVLERVRRREDPYADRFQSPWVAGGQPFLNRTQLRNSVSALLSSPARPILRVNGAEKSGKTYTTEYLYHLVDGRPDIHVVPVKLHPGQGSSYELAELAEELAVPLHPAPFTDRETPAARRRWLVGHVLRRPGLWVFVLDGFGVLDTENRPQVKADVREFVELLADQLANPEYARKMRLVLLNFGLPLAGNWRVRTMDDATAPIVRDELIAYLHRFNDKMQAEAQPAKMLDPGGIPQIADGLLMVANAAPFPIVSLYESLMSL